MRALLAQWWPAQMELWPRARYGFDGWLAGAAAALLALGLVMVASASVAHAERLTGDPLYFFQRQMLFVAMGLSLAGLVYCVPTRQWEYSSGLLYGFALLLLILVLIPGVGIEVNSARRWIDLGMLRLQASEPARLALFMFLAGYIARQQQGLQGGWMGLIKPLAALMIPAALLLAEPDFGATAILFGVAFLMLFLGGARLFHYLALATVGVVALSFIAIVEPYRVRRLMSFLNPWADVENAGWQLTQSLIAVGRGDWTGVGLGNSVQKLLYLPEMHTDFIFAILAEELGLIGIASVLILFGIVVWRGFAIGLAAERAGKRFQAYLSYGLAGGMGLQALVNMSVNMGLLPTKGLTLPFISYGGSSMMSACAVIGLLLRVDYENRVHGFARASAERAP